VVVLGVVEVAAGAISVVIVAVAAPPRAPLVRVARRLGGGALRVVEV
jgi:hypothetical protein